MRRAAFWLAAVAAATALWSAYVPVPGRGRLDAVVPFTQLLALRPAVASALLVLAAIGLAYTWRRPAAAGACALVLASAALAWAQMAPRAIVPAAAPEASRVVPSITVVTINTLESRVAPPELARLARRTRADVVALPETNLVRAGIYARALSRGRGQRWLAFGDRTTAPTDAGPRPTSVLVRAALGPRRLPAPVAARRAHAQVRLRLTRVRAGSGAVAGPAIAAVHVVPPPPAASERDWRRDLLALRPLCRAGWVVAGDLNATVDHSPMRALHRAGCADAAAATGHGLAATWTGGPAGMFRIVIDHVLTSGRWRATASGVSAVAGSDHRAAWARITAAG